MSEAVARGGAEENGQAGTGLRDLPAAAIPLLISPHFWRERHLSRPRFLSAHPCSLLLIYLSKSPIFCISEEDVNGRNPPLSARAPRGGDAQEAPPRGPEAKVIKRRGVEGWCGALGARSPLPRRAGRDPDPGAATAPGTHPALLAAGTVLLEARPGPPPPTQLHPRAPPLRPPPGVRQARLGRRPAPAAGLPWAPGPSGHTVSAARSPLPAHPAAPVPHPPPRAAPPSGTPVPASRGWQGSGWARKFSERREEATRGAPARTTPHPAHAHPHTPGSRVCASAGHACGLQSLDPGSCLRGRARRALFPHTPDHTPRAEGSFPFSFLSFTNCLCFGRETCPLAGPVQPAFTR